MSKIKSLHYNGHVLFFNPPSSQPLYRGIVCTWLSKARYLWQPFDFILLSALVPSSMQISFIDSFIHRVKIEDVIQFIRKNAITHIVMSMSSIVWSQDWDSLVKLCKALPDIKISVFGDIFQECYFVEQVLLKGVAIIRHPLDLQIREYFETGRTITTSLLQKLEGNNRLLPPVGVERCVEFPLPRHEIFISKKYRSPFDKYRRSAIVTTSWGCPYACSYCSWSSPYLPFAYKSLESVLNELELLYRLKVREVFFADLSFGHPPQVSLDMLNTMLEQKWRFSWHCYVKVGSISEQFLQTMHKAGCHTIIIGVESSNLDFSKFNRQAKLDDINNIINLCHKLKMDVCGDFILGLNELSDDWRELARFAINLNLDFASFNIYTPLLGSLERYRKIEQGIIKEGEWGFDTTGHKKSLIEHSENRTKCVKEFYARPEYWLKRLFKIRTVDEFLIKLEEAMNLFMPRKLD